MLSQEDSERELDLIWGASAIGKAVGLSERQTKHILSIGELPARKVGGRWVASRRKLQEHFENAPA
jgi:hypothetical protein